MMAKHAKISKSEHVRAFIRRIQRINMVGAIMVKRYYPPRCSTGHIKSWGLSDKKIQIKAWNMDRAGAV
jgi:hypothetical protein